MWRVAGYTLDGKRIPQASFAWLWRAKRYVKRNPPPEPIPGKPLYRLIIERVLVKH